jgi:predicted RecA/RadA family phage recombinase
MPYLDDIRNPAPLTAPTGGIAAATFKLFQKKLAYFPEAVTAGAVGSGYWMAKRVFAAPKATGATWSIGQALYWSTANNNFQTTAPTGRTLPQAMAVTAAASGDSTGDIELTGLPVV